jgi:hypothetical protein
MIESPLPSGRRAVNLSAIDELPGLRGIRILTLPC